jgi:hypothetical protein
MYLMGVYYFQLLKEIYLLNYGMMAVDLAMILLHHMDMVEHFFGGKEIILEMSFGKISVHGVKTTTLYRH